MRVDSSKSQRLYTKTGCPVSRDSLDLDDKQKNKIEKYAQVVKCELPISLIGRMRPAEMEFHHTLKLYKSQILRYKTSTCLRLGRLIYPLGQIQELYHRIFATAIPFQQEIKVGNNNFFIVSRNKAIHIFDMTSIDQLVEYLDKYYSQRAVMPFNELSSLVNRIKLLWDEIKIVNNEIKMEDDNGSLNLLLKAPHINTAELVAVKMLNEPKARFISQSRYLSAKKELVSEAKFMTEFFKQGDIPGIQRPLLTTLAKHTGFIAPLYPIDLFDLLNQNDVPFEQRLSGIFELICGFYYISEDYIYSDFKLENILVNIQNDIFKMHLADFGGVRKGEEVIAGASRSNPLGDLLCTQEYTNRLDYEVLRRQFESYKGSKSLNKIQQEQKYIEIIKKMSTFAMGSTVFFVLTSKPDVDSTYPYSLDEFGFATPYQSTKLTLLENAAIGPRIKKILTNIIQSNLDDRPLPQKAAQDLMDAVLEHPALSQDKKQVLISMRELMHVRLAQRKRSPCYTTRGLNV